MDAGEGLPSSPAMSADQTTLRWLANPYGLLDECSDALGDTFTLQFTRFGTHVVLSDPRDVREVMTADVSLMLAGRGNSLLEPVLGAGSLLLVDGDRHASLRVLLQGALRAERVAACALTATQATERHTRHWKDGEVVGIQETALAISREVVLRMTLGVDVAECERIGVMVREWMKLIATNAAFDEPSESALHRRFAQARRALDDELQDHVARRSRDPACRREPQDLLSILVDARRQGFVLDDDEIRDQLVTMILAGHETTASSIAWAMLCIHDAPHARCRLLEELDAPGQRTGELGVFLQAVCMETLRLRPVVPVVSRQLARPWRLRGRILPADLFVTPCAYLSHRRADVFSDPNDFRPERFLEHRYSPYEYFPFGGGARRCIGMGLAMTEMQVVLAGLLRRFTFTPAASKPVRPVRRAVTIVPSGGARMRIQRRQPAAES